MAEERGAELLRRHQPAFDEIDSRIDARTRFEMVFEQAVRLCRMPEAELAALSQAATETVVFNACWGLTHLPALFRDRIDAVLMDRLIESVHLAVG